jgi:putative peptidoglycan lipid II flippase
MKKSSLVKSTGIVAASTLLSRIMGFIRDMLIAKYFGASGSLDGFFVAFRIPNLFRRLVAEGALTISFIPVYTEYLETKGEDEALKLAQKTLSILTLALTTIVSLGIIFSPQIVKIFAFGFSDPHTIDLTVYLTRLMFPYLFFVGLVAFAMGVLNSHGHFFAPSFSPVLMNMGFISGAMFMRDTFSEPLYGLAAGVLLGGVMQVITQIPYMIKSGFRMTISFDFAHPGIRKIFKMITPALFGIAIYQINILMSTILASFLPAGSISYLFYSDRLTEIVLGVFIVSIGNVILPEMSRFSARDNMAELRTLYTKAVSAALFLAIPASIALMTIGQPIISVLLMRGEFTPHHAAMTEKALFYASAGIFSISVLRITTPTFYSLKDTKLPVIASAVSFVINIVSGYILMQTELKHAGLTLANTISATVQMLILLVWLQKRTGKLNMREILIPVFKFTAAGALMAALLLSLAGYADWNSDPFSKRLFVLMGMVASGAAVYFLVCATLGVKEIKYAGERIRRMFGRKG